MGIKNKLLFSAFFLVVIVIGGILSSVSNAKAQSDTMAKKVPENSEVATFAGGCFWCMQPPYDNQAGVLATIVGYTGGKTKDPSYEKIGTGETGHAEAVRVLYNPDVVTYEQLLEIFWRNIDPTDAGGQFADRGSQYRTAIFYHTDEQRVAAQASIAKLEESRKFGSKIKTEVVPAGEFYRAEEYHQEYYKKNSVHYKLYSAGSGREGFLERTWGEKDLGK